MLNLAPIAGEIVMKSMAAFFLGGGDQSCFRSIRHNHEKTISNQSQINQRRSGGNKNKRRPSSIMIAQHAFVQSQTDHHIHFPS